MELHAERHEDTARDGQVVRGLKRSFSVHWRRGPTPGANALSPAPGPSSVRRRWLFTRAAGGGPNVPGDARLQSKPCTREKNWQTDFAIGCRRGDAVMVHASVRAVGEVAGGPDEIHLALKDAVTADGTLMMYAAARATTTRSGAGT